MYVIRVADEQEALEPDQTAVRVALWRALHLDVDAAPPVLVDEVGLKLADPDPGWRERPDMDPVFTSGFRASVVARARFIEDLVTAEADAGVGQYVLLGAGLDTFVQRRPEFAERLRVFEVDRPAPQAWKRQRLIDAGYGVPGWLRLVPVDFEAGASWWDLLIEAGFAPAAPAVAVSTGVRMYLTKEANAATLRQLAALAPGSTVAMTFMLPLELNRRVGPAAIKGTLFPEAARFPKHLVSRGVSPLAVISRDGGHACPCTRGTESHAPANA